MVSRARTTLFIVLLFLLLGPSSTLLLLPSFSSSSSSSSSFLLLLLLCLPPLTLLLPPPPPLTLHTTPYIYSLILLTMVAHGSQVGIPLRTSSNGRKNTFAFFLLFVFTQKKLRRFTMNNRHRSALVRAPVHYGQLSTVKHICFVTVFC